MGDWAEERARKWLESLGGRLEGPGPIGEAYGWLEVSDENAASLAALLREVQDEAAMSGTMSDWVAKRKSAWRTDLLAEVRRVVEEEMSGEGKSMIFPEVRTRILSRLDKL